MAILSNLFDEILFDRPEKRAKIGVSNLFVCMANRRLGQIEKRCWSAEEKKGFSSAFRNTLKLTP